jgi:phage virion morphogenesis protein
MGEMVMAGSFDDIIKLIEKKIKKLEEGLEKPMKDILKNVLIPETKKNFASNQSPEGEKWRELSKKTKRKKNKNRDQILRDEDNLYSSLMKKTNGSIQEITPSGTKTTLSYGTRDRKAGIHQEGKGKIPQRKFLGLTEDMKQSIRNTIAAHIREIMNGD